MVNSALPGGTVTVSWSDIIGVPFTTTTTLFNLDVQLTGTVGQSSTLALSAVSFVNDLGGSLNATPCDGAVSITMGTAQISGVVQTCGGNPIANVDIDATGVTPSSLSSAATTGAYGPFSVASTPININPDQITDGDNAWTVGLDIGDAVIIKRYLAALQTIDECQMIAADVNGNGSVDVGDAVLIEQLLAFIISTVSTNDSWRFIDDPSTLSPVPNTLSGGFNESRTYGTVSSSITNADFTGIKIGDMNMSVESMSTISSLVNSNDNGSSNRSSGVVIEAADRSLRTGETVNLKFNIRDFETFYGIQTTFDFDASSLELVDITSDKLAGLSMQQTGLSEISSGKVALVWSDGYGYQGALDNVFTISLKAKKDINSLEGLIQIDDSYIDSKVVMDDSGLKPVEFILLDQEDRIDIVHEFELLENRPNPFNQSTTITFFLPESEQAELNIYDLQGRTIYAKSQLFEKGRNEVEVKRSELRGAEGLLYYSVSTKNNLATRKMMIFKR